MISLISVMLLFCARMSLIYCSLSSDTDVIIEGISCDNTGVKVNVTTGTIFKGVVYTQGNTYNHACRYKSPELGTRYMTLFIALMDCGNLLREVDDYIEVTNKIVIQKNKVVETRSDVVLSVSCKFPVASYKDSRFFSYSRHPTRLYEPGLISWMDFYSGEDILGIDIPNRLAVGEEFSIIVHLKDGGKNDLFVEKCWAHNNETFLASDRVIEIYNSQNCQYPEWISKFSVMKGNKNVSDTMASAVMKAFKFIDTYNLYITCSIQICDNFCVKYCGNFEKRVKRSNPERNSRRDLNERYRLLKATIKALGIKLIDRNREISLQNDTNFYRRSNEVKGIFLNSSHEIDTTENGQKNIANGTVGNTEHETLHDIQHDISKITGDVYIFNLTNNVIITHHKLNYRYEYSYPKSDTNFNDGKTGFIVSTVVLSIISLCLIVVCISLTICLKKEKKKIRNYRDDYLRYGIY